MTTEDKAAATALAPFFAAARAGAPEPSTALLSAILADAAEVAAARAMAPPPPMVARSRWRDALAPALGGWRGAAALAACALLGFWLGLASGVTLDGTTLAAGSTAADDGATSVEVFFDLASVE